MQCECGGILLVKAIEEYPEELSSKEKLTYNRVCDVECVECGKIYYSQPYDDGKSINQVKKTQVLKARED